MINNIGFLGCGRIAEPMVRSLARQFPEYRIRVSQRSSEVSQRLNELENVDVCDNQILIDSSDVIIICLLASVARAELPGLKFKPTQKIISVMADISLEEVARLTAPAQPPCVTIPLPFIEQGGCPLPVYPQSAVLEQLFGDENPIIVVDTEAAIAPHFAATAILSTTMKQLDTVSGWLSGHTGNAIGAEVYVAGLVGGYLREIPKDGQGRFKAAMADLSTEGGLNNQLRTHIGQSGHFGALAEGLDALAARLRG